MGRLGDRGQEQKDHLERCRGNRIERERECRENQMELRCI